MRKRPLVAEQDAGRRWAVIGLLSVGMIIAYASRSNLSVALVTPGVLSYVFMVKERYAPGFDDMMSWRRNLVPR